MTPSVHAIAARLARRDPLMWRPTKLDLICIILISRTRHSALSSLRHHQQHQYTVMNSFSELVVTNKSIFWSIVVCANHGDTKDGYARTSTTSMMCMSRRQSCRSNFFFFFLMIGPPPNSPLFPSPPLSQ